MRRRRGGQSYDLGLPTRERPRKKQSCVLSAFLKEEEEEKARSVRQGIYIDERRVKEQTQKNLTGARSYT